MINNCRATEELSCLVAIDNRLHDCGNLGAAVQAALVTSLMMNIAWLIRRKPSSMFLGVQLVQEIKAFLADPSKPVSLRSLRRRH